MKLLPEKIWSRQPGDFFCIVVAKRVTTSSKLTNFAEWWFERSEFGTIEKWLKDEGYWESHEVYFCPHGFSHQRRRKENAVLPNLLWSDLDAVDPHALAKMSLEPTYAWQSSPGRWAAAWLMKDGKYDDDLAQRLSYKIGADKAGWDLTQLLRVPGTRNHKYDGAPPVLMLWDNGPQYTKRDLHVKAGSGAKGVVDRIWSKWRSKVPDFVRRELYTPKRISIGKRSEVLWRLNHLLIEAGVPEDEVFQLLRPSPWNKFHDRRDGDDQLRREISKAKEQVDFGGGTKAGEEDVTPLFEVISADTLKPEDIDWVWPGYLARGSITALMGDPGLGKSYASLMIGKAIMDGGELPGCRAIAKGKVLYFDTENHPAQVTRRRLEDNGAVNLKNLLTVSKPFSILDDRFLPTVRAVLADHRPSLVIFDPIMGYLGEGDVYKANEVTAALEPLGEIARDFNCAMLLVSHLTKNMKTSPLYRAQGSIAFVGVARIVIMSSRMGDGRTAMGQVKNNLGITRREILPFRVYEAMNAPKVVVNGHPVKEGGSIFKWDKVESISIEEVMSMAPDKASSKEEIEKKETIAKFLSDLLDDGPVEEGAVKRAVDAHEKRGLFAMRDVSKYREELGVSITTSGFGRSRRTVWEFSVGIQRDRSNSRANKS